MYVDLNREGDSNKYSGTFKVGKYKQTGSWHINNFHFVSPKWYSVNNANYYNYGVRGDFGTDLFSVSGTTPDVTPPKISYNDYSISKSVLTKDDILTIKLKIYDDLSGISSASIFYNIKNETEAFELEYNDKTGYYEAIVKSNDIELRIYKLNVY